MKPAWIPFGCTVLYFSNFSNFSDFGYSTRGILILYGLESTGWRIQHFWFRPGQLCVPAPSLCSWWCAGALCSSMWADPLKPLPNGC